MVVKISKQINCERFETQSSSVTGHTVEGFCKVTLEYRVEWKLHMRKNCKDTVLRRVRSNRQRRGNSVSGKGTTRDLLDIIDEAATTVVVDAGEEQESTEPSDQQCLSEQSFDSTMSDPSSPHMLGNVGMCSVCQKLYQTVKKKRPLRKAVQKRQFLDNYDPTSLTCDQWVMQKRRGTRRLRRQEDSIKSPPWEWDDPIIKRVRERFRMKQPTGEMDQRTCSRPHIFLKRNLKKCMVVVKKGRRTVRKSRRRQSGQDGSLTKQPRLNESSFHSDNSLNSDSSHHGDPVSHRGSRTSRKSRRKQSRSTQDGSPTKQSRSTQDGSPTKQSRSSQDGSPTKQSRSSQDGSPTKPHVVDSGCHSDASLNCDPSLPGDPIPHSESLDPISIGSSSQPECSIDISDMEEGSSSDECFLLLVIPTSVTYEEPVQLARPPTKPSITKEAFPTSVTYEEPVQLARPPTKPSITKEAFKELFAKALCKRSTIEQLD